jgi:GNAT superfamily N-acetyltransferase
MKREVLRTYLELADPAACPRLPAPVGARVERVAECPPSFFRYLYVEVGRPYNWRDRLSWSDEQIRTRLADPAVSLHALTVSGAPAGYYELQRHPDAAVEIVYFGLLPEFCGRGLGKYLLGEAVASARELGAARVWLHTCDMVGPAALPNYVCRGFRPFRTETYTAELPD